MNYPSHWRLAYLLAFFFHLWAWLFVSLALPHLTLSLAQPEPVQELEWAPDLPPGEGDSADPAVADLPAGPVLPQDAIAEAEDTDAPPPEDAEPPLEEETPIVAEDAAAAIAQLKKTEQEGKDDGKGHTIIIRGGGGGGQERQAGEALLSRAGRSILRRTGERFGAYR